MISELPICAVLPLTFMYPFSVGIPCTPSSLSPRAVYTLVPRSSCRYTLVPRSLSSSSFDCCVVAANRLLPRDELSSSSFDCCVVAAKGLLPSRDELSSSYPRRHLIVVLLPRILVVSSSFCHCCFSVPSPSQIVVAVAAKE